MGLYKRGRKWWIDEIVEGERVHCSLKTTDKRLAEGEASAIRDEIQERARRQRRGLPDESKFEATAASPVADLVEEFAKELERRGRSKKHVRNARHRLTAMTAGARNLAAVTPEGVRAALARIAGIRYHAPNESGDGHLPTAKTLNEHRAMLNAFFRWLVREGRWNSNPVEAVAPLRSTGPETPRAALPAEGLARLLESAPEARAIVYRTAAVTGLRRSELAQLVWSDVDLESSSLLVRAKIAKNKRGSVLPLPPALRDALKASRAGAPAGARVFPAIPKLGTFYRDLHAAGLTLEPDGRVDEGKIDFHALRVSFATGLARTGSPLALAQRLMRHSTPALTSSVYTRLELHDARAAVERVDAALVAASDAAGAVGENVGTERRKRAGSCAKDAIPGARLSGTKRKHRGPASRDFAGIPVLGATTESASSFSGRRDSNPPSMSPKPCGDESSDKSKVHVGTFGYHNPDSPHRTHEDLARDLLARAATAPDPRVLLDAAQVLLELARAEREAEGVTKIEDARKRVDGA